MEAINNAGAEVGILTAEGVILGAERKQTSKLLERSRLSEKIYLFDEHIACAAAGLTSDANILIDYARRASQSHRYYYQQSMPVEQLVRQICNAKQAYTQHGGLRPFGVGFLYAGWDELLGFQLYSSDPSGNYGGWKAIAIGMNNQNASNVLKEEYKEGLSLQEGLQLALKVVCKSMDTTSPAADKCKCHTVELVTLTKAKAPKYTALTEAQIAQVLKDAHLAQEGN